MAAATTFVASAKAGGDSAAATRSVGRSIVPSWSTVTSRRPPRSSARIAGPFATKISVTDSGIPSQPASPRTPSRYVSATLFGSSSAAAKIARVEVCHPLHQRRAQRESPTLEQRERADAIRIPQREVDRDLAALAAADHDRRRRRERVEERGRVVSLLVHIRDERLRALAAPKPAAVVDDRAAACPEHRGRVHPQRRRAAGAVDAEDRLTGAVLLVVERDTVHTDVRHSPRWRRACRTRLSSLRYAAAAAAGS